MKNIIMTVLVGITLVAGGVKEEEPPTSDLDKIIDEITAYHKLVYEKDEPPTLEELAENYVPEVKEQEEEIEEQEVQEYNEYDTPEFHALVRATFRRETGNGSSSMWVNMNNPGGIKCNGPGQQCSSDGYRFFESKQEGLDAQVRLLEWYVDNYGYDFRTIREVYCQCGPEDYGKFMELYYEEYGRGTYQELYN